MTKLRWKKHSYSIRTADSPSKKLEYRVEIIRGILGYEICAKVSTRSMTRNLGWCPSITIAKKRCQDTEDFFDNHKISLD